MGWLFTQGSSKSDIIRDLTATEENETRRWETLTHSVRGNVLWAVVEITHKPEQTTKCFIACYLLRSDKGYGWGYKDMEESMFPYYFSCPLKYLAMVPVANADWRAEVQKYHERRNRKVEIGQKIGLVHASIPWVVITSKRPLLGTYDGMCYRVPRRMLGEALV